MVEVENKIFEKGVIYRITEEDSGTFYIGWTYNEDKRWSEHKSNFYNKNNKGYNKPFYVEIRRLNKKITDCAYETLATYYNITLERLHEIEQEYLLNFKQNKLIFKLFPLCFKSKLLVFNINRIILYNKH